jgi:uncharacterized membrane protein YkoI
LLSTYSRAAAPPKDRINFETARATALKQFPGKITSSGLEQRGNVWIYSFEIINSDKTKREITIDAMTGKEVNPPNE